jgi:hypothetical protein
MGLRTILLTSFESDLDLKIMSGIEIINQIGKGTTTFKNIYSADGRTQYLQELAPQLDLAQIPAKLLKSRIVHFGPVAGEVSILGGKYFPDSKLGYSLQGWLRQWDDTGKVLPADLAIPTENLPAPGTAFVSIEDLGFQRSALDQILLDFPDLILTKGRDGAELYQNGRILDISTNPVKELDPTGAGDIFAAGYLIARHIQDKSELDSVRFANALAGLSLYRDGVEGIPTASEIAELQRNY